MAVSCVIILMERPVFNLFMPFRQLFTISRMSFEASGLSSSISNHSQAASTSASKLETSSGSSEPWLAPVSANCSQHIGKLSKVIYKLITDQEFINIESISNFISRFCSFKMFETKIQQVHAHFGHKLISGICLKI